MQQELGGRTVVRETSWDSFVVLAMQLQTLLSQLRRDGCQLLPGFLFCHSFTKQLQPLRAALIEPGPQNDSVRADTQEQGRAC